MVSIQKLGPKIYPSESVHSQKIAEYFGKNKIFCFSEQEKAVLKEIELTFVCFVNRSGSTVLTELISNCGYPTIKFSEPFNCKGIINKAQKFGFTSFSEYFFHLITQKSVENKLALKVANHQLFWLSQNGFLSIFKKVNFIYVKRKDTLKQAISLGIASQTSEWTSLKKSEMSDLEKENLLTNISNLIILRIMKKIVDSYSLFDYFFACHSREPLTIYYEDFFSNQEQIINIILNYLNWEISPEKIKPLTMKVQSSDLNQKLEARFKKEFNLFD